MRSEGGQAYEYLTVWTFARVENTMNVAQWPVRPRAHQTAIGQRNWKIDAELWTVSPGVSTFKLRHCPTVSITLSIRRQVGAWMMADK